MSSLPKVLSVVADPDAAGFFVNREPPWIAQPVRPVFRARVFHAHERIIFGNGVRSRAVRMVDVDAEYAAGQIAQILASDPFIGIGRTVAGGNVEHAVMTKA